MKYQYQTKQGFIIARLYCDKNNPEYLTAIVHKFNEFVICRGYNRSTGEWNQGHYGYSCEDSAIYHMHMDFESIIEMKPIYTRYQGYYCD